MKAAVGTWGRRAGLRDVMKLIYEYIADAVKFEHLAADEQRPEIKEQFEKQAAAYRKLAQDRAKKLGIPPPEKPNPPPEKPN